MGENELEVIGGEFETNSKVEIVDINPLHQQDKNFVIDLSHGNLATVAGTAIESLIRTLGDFKNEKLIEIQEVSLTQ